MDDDNHPASSSTSESNPSATNNQEEAMDEMQALSSPEPESTISITILLLKCTIYLFRF